MTEELTHSIVVGTGGLGTGMFLRLDGNHTLGREESRAASLLDQQDRCKLQDILHYVKALLGPRVEVMAVGRVGDDEPGRTVLHELHNTGLDASHVKVVPGKPTLFSVCFSYPDGDGGNLTLNDTASASVSITDIEALRPVFRRHANRGVALAAPEVPMEARRRLLELASEHGFLRVASFLTGEISLALADGVLELVDVLSLNIDEAAELAGVGTSEPPAAVARAAIDRLRALYPGLRIVITAGGRGTWLWDGAQAHHSPSISVPVVNTAGAGDAHLGGLIVGLVGGLGLKEANELATLVSAQKVGCVHTINTDVDMDTTQDLARRANWPFPAVFAPVLSSLN
jgi:ribokinase